MSGNNFGHCPQNCVRICNENIGGNRLGNRTMPKVILLNARSLVVNNVNELEIQIASHNSDVTFVTETWLADQVLDEAVNCSGQNIIRKDRPNGKGGEGIAVYVNDKILIKLRHDLNDSAYECLWVTIRPSWLPRSISKIALYCVYLPPSLKSDEIDKFYDYMNCCYDHTAFIIAGDFNPTSNGFLQKYIIQ